MASEEISLVQPQQRLDNNGLNSQMVFQHEGFRFSSRPRGDSGPKTRELSGFIDDRYFQSQEAAADFRRSLYVDDGNRQGQNLNRNERRGEGSEGDEEEEDEDDDEEEDDDDGDERDVGSSRGLMHSGNNNSNARAIINDNHQLGRDNQYHSAVTISDTNGDMYYSQYMQGPEGSASGQKRVVVENGCGINGRKEGWYSIESGESLRVILSDPLTGALMDDAMILPCGHSFGGGGVQHILRIKACYTCSQQVSEESFSPNLSLRAAVQAFRWEEELNVFRSSKRREKFEKDKSTYGSSVSANHPRGRGVQFPFVVSDRVIIKGNKRTPLRFVGREAIVTTQCLNGWYVVKTFDNAESVKLQYRSLAKIFDDPSSSKPTKMPPNWL